MATYYVRPTNGSDVAAGTTFGTAFKTTQHAIDTVSDGDEIRLCNEANEQPSAVIDIDGAAGSVGTQTAPILVRAGDSVDGSLLTTGYYTLDGTNITTNDLLESTSAASPHYRFHRIRFTEAPYNGVFYPAVTGSQVFTFYNCRFDNNGQNGFENQESSAFTHFYNCRFDNNTENGVSVTATNRPLGWFFGCVFENNGDAGAYGGSVTCSFEHCLFYRNTNEGLNQAGSASAKVQNCTFYLNGSHGVKLNEGNDVLLATVFNNVFYDNGDGGTGYGIYNDGSADEDSIFRYIDYNCFYGNADGHYFPGGTPPGDNNITTEPTFENLGDGTEDFEPASGSNLIGAGFPGVLPTGGTGYMDIGALQREMAAGGGAAVVSNLEIIT